MTENELYELRQTHDRALWTLESRGYRRCNIAACNCNGWHGGNAERQLNEICDALDGCNAVTILAAVKALIAENDVLRLERDRARDAVRRQVESLRASGDKWDAERLERELVWGVPEWRK
jgi:hypothetical protein